MKASGRAVGPTRLTNSASATFAAASSDEPRRNTSPALSQSSVDRPEPSPNSLKVRVPAITGWSAILPWRFNSAHSVPSHRERERRIRIRGGIPGFGQDDTWLAGYHVGRHGRNQGHRNGA